MYFKLTHCKYAKRKEALEYLGGGKMVQQLKIYALYNCGLELFIIRMQCSPGLMG